ncbi:hypothetical protein AnigIFM60653_004260 [Aspergillus niger]|uniref:Uncharacterized protein n=2 Tax=Aspergillus niger TaxID=5061 RepID=A2R9U1_ASPNC|nr:hypothetical protein An18g00200 [Aspergillus niger]GJP98558.1 hypothetical protein AlacWU_11457 [Aspergillus niger]GLA04215.1 hypothetical protein AnigIFM60653_004260 [Aspergillus niger]CAK43097.1 hypothetical protein An18g00200 [Aspergillus niger]
MSREEYINTDNPIQEAHSFISYEIIRNSKVNLITNKMDGTTVGSHITGIRGVCDWDDAGNFCSYEECDQFGKWNFNRVVWSIRQMNSESISSLESGPNISDQKELIGFPKKPRPEPAQPGSVSVSDLPTI